VTAAKKAAPPTTKKAAGGKASPSVKAAGSTAKKAAVKGAAAKATAKRPTPVTKATKKEVPAAKKAAPAPAAKKAPPTKKVAAAKTAPPTKKSAAKPPAPSSAKTAPAVKPEAPVKKAAPPPPKRPTVGPYAKEPKFLEEQRMLLLEERGVYDGQAHDLRAEADSLALEREPGDVQFDEESGEGGTVTVDRERNLALSAQAAAAVEEIDDALRKVERTTYGTCERCFQPIPKARLRALPFARLCVACKSGGLSRR
jgi:RNA polymerase-binding transcription factor DksA